MADTTTIQPGDRCAQVYNGRHVRFVRVVTVGNGECLVDPVNPRERGVQGRFWLPITNLVVQR